MSASIFDSQESNELKERQRLEELKRQAKVQQVKLDKRLNKQKILMGAFLGQVLAGNSEEDKFIQNYVAKNFPEFLTRKSDKELFKSMIESLGGDMGLDEEENSSTVNTQESDRESENSQKTQSYSNNKNDTHDLLSDNNAYSTDESNTDHRG